MRILVACVFFGLLFSIGTAWGQPMYYDELKESEELAPKQDPPLFLRATAAEVKGKVVVWLSRPTPRFTVKKAGPNDPKVFTGTVLVWAADKRSLTLGTGVKAYSHGKPLSKEAVLKALAKQASVVYFERARDDLPDPFYTAMFRDDTVILVH